jgi:ADP-ribose pyrophosphatase YjhB (NUDIX family)
MDKIVQFAESILAIAQNGLVFTQDEFDKQRFRQIQTLATQLLEQKSSLSSEKILNLFLQEEGYATPKVDVRGAVFKDNQILLVQERSDQKWTLPGGWADVGESPSEAVVKEILEESGFIAKVAKVMAIYDKSKHSHPTCIPHIYKIFFICDLIGGEKELSIETCAVDFFSLDNLPPLSEHRVVKNQIERAFMHYRNMDLPTDFD